MAMEEVRHAEMLYLGNNVFEKGDISWRVNEIQNQTQIIYFYHECPASMP
jgi:hypothetical protein